MRRLYKILDRAAWSEAQRAGVFRGAEIDLKDGYIHLSAADQVAETARLHFAGRADLVLVTIDAEALGPELRWEPSRSGALFPHLYGPLDPRTVVDARPLPLNAQGWPDPAPLLQPGPPGEAAA